MEMSRAEIQMKMMNDIAKRKSKAQSKQFRIEVLTDQINNPEKWKVQPEEMEIYKQELEKVKAEE